MTGPRYEDFNKLGENDAKNCIEVTNSDPYSDSYIGIFLFTKYYASRGPLSPAITEKKIIVKSNPSLERDFDIFNNVFT